ncbi:unnamed protein product [Dracunculus medinensis]|uniref:Uncharacterized protein n=1 Tax=Dracunculus medinensis TaxID=318479 RepID=A0A3P7T3B7_DRAME|nr:unnamed protein product [Dracunculus medinensis]
MAVKRILPKNHLEITDDRNFAEKLFIFQICASLNEICSNHRKRPKIYQFNSFDTEGIEIDLN